MDQSKRQRKKELSRLLENQRHELAHTRGRISQELSLGYQFKRSVRNNPLTWFTGSLGTAAVASFILRRPVSPKTKRKGLIRWTLGTAFNIAKPFAAKWALEQAKQRITQEIVHQNQKS